MIVIGSVAVNQNLEKCDRSVSFQIATPLDTPGDGTVVFARQVVCLDQNGARFPTNQESQYVVQKKLSDISVDSVTLPSATVAAGITVNGDGTTSISGALLLAALDVLTDKYASV